MSLEDDLYQQRLERIREIEALGFQAYGHRFDFTHTVPRILADYGDKPAEQLESRVTVRIRPAIWGTCSPDARWHTCSAATRTRL